MIKYIKNWILKRLLANEIDIREVCGFDLPARIHAYGSIFGYDDIEIEMGRITDEKDLRSVCVGCPRIRVLISRDKYQKELAVYVWDQAKAEDPILSYKIPNEK